MGLNVVQEAVDDMAGVAEFVATNNLRDTMAKASARAVELYGLEVLVDRIQDDSSNVTQVRDAGLRVDNPSDRPSIQDEHSVRPREGDVDAV
uniref:Prephenate dehydratase domain-containing protein n=1 Tax=Nelumbo nucifera TaxID=4432 RepID=A0A822XKR7_NELNU|nr:TPA_asm: hypothetical protein HUJ06_020868 [Nelumbo nucifera]